jgi:hypothetical protein
MQNNLLWGSGHDPDRKLQKHAVEATENPSRLSP